MRILPYNHRKKSWDKFDLLTLFYTHTHPPPRTHTHTHTHTPHKQSLANAPRLAQPLPHTYNVGHSKPTHVGNGSIACSNFSCKIFTLEIGGSQTLEETQCATQVKLAWLGWRYLLSLARVSASRELGTLATRGPSILSPRGVIHDLTLSS